ncbi:MAG: hypothetical protein AUK63_1991 [bacterium P3]|nr:MAG: hypothetical protein AUK63_1991 [bacterium P3]KWW34151.1 MAG: hypothetical protein F083_2488 [bacterium F083]
MDETYKYTRPGFLGELEVGLTCQLSKASFVGLNIGIDAGRNFSKSLDLPAALVAGDKNDINGYTLSLVYGVKF